MQEEGSAHRRELADLVCYVAAMVILMILLGQPMKFLGAGT